MRRIPILAACLLAATLISCAPRAVRSEEPTKEATAVPKEGLTLATFGGGCFWCTEAVFAQLEGVDRVVSGYSGGKGANPTYEQVCTGTTGHAEVIQVHYDPKIITYQDLLEVFWHTHDPTTLNRQGHDVGTQYRSVIFYHDEEQKRIAEESKRQAGATGDWDDPIVTEISPYQAFYAAEGYHQEYFESNPNQPYCRAIIAPKVAKFRRQYSEKLKE